MEFEFDILWLDFILNINFIKSYKNTISFSVPPIECDERIINYYIKWINVMRGNLN